MFDKIRKMKNKKGFTLVELIVVLVILAILAALLIPALTGYIDKANKEKVIAETRMVVMAIQTEATSAYAQGGVNATWAATDDHVKTIINLAEISNLKETDSVAKFYAVVDASCKVDTVYYYDGAKYYCTYKTTPDANGEKYTVSTTAPADVTLGNTVKVGTGAA